MEFRTCTRCAGMGKTTCSYCHGTGAAWGVAARPCTFCVNGRVLCTACKGTGFVLRPSEPPPVAQKPKPGNAATEGGQSLTRLTVYASPDYPVGPGSVTFQKVERFQNGMGALHQSYGGKFALWIEDGAALRTIVQALAQEAPSCTSVFEIETEGESVVSAKYIGRITSSLD